MAESGKATASPEPAAESAGRWARALAWSAHLYTALGLILAAGIAVLVVRGTPHDFRWAFLLMVAATIVDATDGTLARAVRVKQVLPEFDGRRLDDIIDYMTYTALPLLLVWRAELLPARLAWCLLPPLVASAYGFCQSAAKTDDGYFLGFPSYWNVVALYLYVLVPPPWVSVPLVLMLSALTFVPMRYLYPSQPGRLNRLATVLGAVWGAGLLWVLTRLDAVEPNAVRRGMLASLAYPAFYMIGSCVVSLREYGVGAESRKPKAESRTGSDAMTTMEMSHRTAYGVGAESRKPTAESRTPESERGATP